MSDQQRPILNFQEVRGQCGRGSAKAWRDFLNLYTPLFAHLLAVYSPAGPEASPDILRKMLAALAENDFARFRATPSQSEREFLAEVRALLLDVSLDWAPMTTTASSSAAVETSTLPVAFDLDKLGKLVDGLPLLHQEMVFFRLCGYTDASLERTLRLAPRVAQAAFARLDPDYAAVQHLERDRCPWPIGWLTVLRQARTAKKDDCPELHQFMRIHDGQVSWYEKEPVERHVASCRYCLERWTALREVNYWRRVAQPMAAAQVGELLGTLPVIEPPKKSLLRRMFG